MSNQLLHETARRNHKQPQRNTIIVCSLFIVYLIGPLSFDTINIPKIILAFTVFNMKVILEAARSLKWQVFLKVPEMQSVNLYQMATFMPSSLYFFCFLPLQCAE